MSTEVSGFHDPRFAPLVEQFAAVVRDDGPGAALCVEIGGRPVVDVWAGLADASTGRRWQRDTPVLVFSCTKGWLAACILRLVAEGRVGLDDPIVRHWPEFAAPNSVKARVTIADALSHRAGLPFLDHGVTFEDVLSWHGVVRAVERQPLRFPPGSGWSYHALTYGYLLGEVVHRVTGRLPGTYFAEVFAGPLGLDSWIGTSDEVLGRAAHVVAGSPWSPPTPDLVVGSVEEAVAPIELGGALTAFDLDSEQGWNSVALLRAQIPAAGGVSTARSLARFWSALVDPEHPVVPAPLLAAATLPRSEGQPVTGGVNDGLRWGLGFEVAGDGRSPLLGPTSFGHDGAAGSLGFGDTARGVGFGFATAEFTAVPHERADLLVARLADVLDHHSPPHAPPSATASGVPR